LKKLTASFQGVRTVQRSISSLLVLLSLALTAPALRAQVLYGSLVGTITDQSGAVVPKAQIKASNPATGEVREVTTDADGRYTIGNVVPGTYNVQVSATGFQSVTTTGVNATINTVTRVDMQLQVGAQT